MAGLRAGTPPRPYRALLPDELKTTTNCRPIPALRTGSPTCEAMRRELFSGAQTATDCADEPCSSESAIPPPPSVLPPPPPPAANCLKNETAAQRGQPAQLDEQFNQFREWRSSQQANIVRSPSDAAPQSAATEIAELRAALGTERNLVEGLKQQLQSNMPQSSEQHAAEIVRELALTKEKLAAEQAIRCTLESLRESSKQENQLQQKISAEEAIAWKRKAEEVTEQLQSVKQELQAHRAVDTAQREMAQTNAASVAQRKEVELEQSNRKLTLELQQQQQQLEEVGSWYAAAQRSEQMATQMLRELQQQQLETAHLRTPGPPACYSGQSPAHGQYASPTAYPTGPMLSGLPSVRTGKDLLSSAFTQTELMARLGASNNCQSCSYETSDIIAALSLQPNAARNLCSQCVHRVQTR